MDIDDDRIKVVAGKLMDGKLDTFIENICNLKHREVSEVKADIKTLSDGIIKYNDKITNKFTTLYLLLISVLAAGVANLVLK